MLSLVRATKKAKKRRRRKKSLGKYFGGKDINIYTTQPIVPYHRSLYFGPSFVSFSFILPFISTEILHYHHFILSETTTITEKHLVVKEIGECIELAPIVSVRVVVVVVLNMLLITWFLSVMRTLSSRTDT